jgi:hypothetical protein
LIELLLFGFDIYLLRDYLFRLEVVLNFLVPSLFLLVDSSGIARIIGTAACHELFVIMQFAAYKDFTSLLDLVFTLSSITE